MTRSTRNLLRIISIVIVLAVVLMELNFIPRLLNYRMWFIVVAYGLLLLSTRK
ncbi:MAG: hypothetical protein AAGA85_03305 [Bacteroidota bacterium]